MAGGSGRGKQRLVCVTGGSRGVGRAIVERFCAGGARVAAVGRDEPALRNTVEAASRRGGEAFHAVLDVTDEDGVAAFFGELGPVDVLVNSAGVAWSAPVERTSLADWEGHLAVNATGAFLCTRAVLPAMRARDLGRIVMIASTAAHQGYRYSSAYTASKHALVGLMRAVALEVAGTGVTVNAVSPAFIRTQMTERSVARIVEVTGRTAEQAEEELAGASPLGRLLEPDEVALSVEFLASETAGAINGQTIVIDGGGFQR